MSEWRPIASAPKDGTFVLGCLGGSWEHEYDQWRMPTTICYRAYHPNAPGKRQWRNSVGHPCVCTHWIPLPDPPIEQEARDAES